MFEQLLQYNNLGVFLLRLVVGLIFVYHSIPKLKNPKGMSAMVGMGAGIIFVLGVVELLAGLGLVFGFYVGLSALLLSLIMVGAIAVKIMKWSIPFSAMDKTGWEFDLVLLATNLMILLGGGGSIGI